MLEEWRLPATCRVSKLLAVKPEAIEEDAVAILDQNHRPAANAPRVENVEVDSRAETDLLLRQNNFSVPHLAERSAGFIEISIVDCKSCDACCDADKAEHPDPDFQA